MVEYTVKDLNDHQIETKQKQPWIDLDGKFSDFLFHVITNQTENLL